MIKRTRCIMIGLQVIMLMFISCHTETPSGIDNTDPTVQILTVFTETDTLYDSAAENSFVDFSDSLFTQRLFVRAKVSDNQSVYKIKLQAEDYFTGEEYEIDRYDGSDGSELVISLDYKDFPVVQDGDSLNVDFQKFYLKASVSDESENIAASGIKLGLNILKPYPCSLLYYELGLLEEVAGGVVDFRLKNKKLAFVQFMSKGCLSCVEEALEMKVMYQDTVTYDLTKYSHSLFGNYTFTDAAELASLVKKPNRLPFDCFWDGNDSVKEFFESIIGKNIENEVFAILPSGKIEAYDYLAGSFEDWIHLMYSTAYPTK